jgi:hypothetical protein
MIAPHWHTIILDARPIADPKGMSLKEAFSNVFLNFSHFARAGDFGIISPEMQWMPLVRNMIYQCANNQKSTDFFAPSHHGGLDAPICPENTGSVHGQMKNWVDFTDVLLNPYIRGKLLNKLPTLSLVHDLGLKESRVYPHDFIPAKVLRGGSSRTENIHL